METLNKISKQMAVKVKKSLRWKRGKWIKLYENWS
jgi:hypothetical protein